MGQLGADKDKKNLRRRNDRQDGGRRGGNGLKAIDFDLEWDDYDLHVKPKDEEPEEDVELVLPEEYLPLVSCVRMERGLGSTVFSHTPVTKRKPMLKQESIRFL